MIRPYRPHDVYTVTCVCGKEIESVTKEMVCPACGRLSLLEWGKHLAPASG